MPATDFSAMSLAQKTLWAAQTYQEAREKNYWMSNGFVGKNTTDMNTPVHRITELTETERGARCIMQLVADLQGDGVAADNKLEDNEEALVNDTEEINIDMLRHGVRSKGEMSEQKTVIRFRAQAKGKLSFWMGNKLDELMFLTIAGRAYSLKLNGSARGASQLTQLAFAGQVVAPTTNRILYAGSATSEATLSADDKMSWSVIVRAKAKAERELIKPINSGGKEYFVLLVSSEQRRDLVLDPTYQAIVKSAAERGKENPLFKNAIAVVDGVVIHAHNKVFNTLGLSSGSRWGSTGTVHGAQAQLLGAQAMGFATIGNAVTREETKDYGNRPGIAFGRKFGLLKPRFQRSIDTQKEDFGTLTVKTAAAAT
jgi:N4-gp56 family major capsid protein